MRFGAQVVPFEAGPLFLRPFNMGSHVPGDERDMWLSSIDKSVFCVNREVFRTESDFI